MNKEYNLKLDLQFKCNNSKMIFDEFDKNTSDFFMQITRQGEKIDISNAIPTLLVLKPNGVVVSQILNVKDNLVYGNLNNSLKDEVGTYIAKLMLVEGNKKTFISNISYEVTENALLGKIDNDIVEDERYSVLLQLLERLSNIELQEQTRIDNESSRIEAENLREKSIEKIKNDIDFLVNETNKKVNDNLNSNISKIDNLIIGTKEELNKYKNDKDKVINEDLEEFKENTNKSINNYKTSKDVEINNSLNTYKTNTTNDINNFKNTVNSKIDKYKNDKDQAINEYIEGKSLELDSYVEAKNNEIDLYVSEKDILIGSKISEIDNAKTQMQDSVNNKLIEVDNAEQIRQQEHESRQQFLNGFEGKLNTVVDDVAIIKDDVVSAREANKRQDMFLQGLYNENLDGRVTVKEEGSAISLTNSVDGFVEIVGLEGNTLVNYCTDGAKELALNGDIDVEGTFVTLTEGVDNGLVKNTGYNVIIKPNTQYTVAFDTDKSGEVGINLGGSKVTTANNVATVTTPSTLVDDTLRLTGKGIKASKVRLLEGDKTNWIPSHFEGMKSSFEDKLQDDGTYKMEILSSNENLFNVDALIANQRDNKNKIKLSKLDNGFRMTSLVSGTWLASNTMLKLKPNKRYKIKFKTKNDGVLGSIKFWTPNPFWVYVDYGIHNGNQEYEHNFTTNKEGEIHIQLNTTRDIVGQSTIDITDISIAELNHIENKSNKIQFSSIEPLRGVGDVKDRFVFKDNKLMIERSCSIREYQEGDYELSNVLTDEVNTVYILDIPIYEEIPFELQRLILEGYKNGTLFIDTNIPPTVTASYTANIPVVSKLNKVNETTETNTEDIAITQMAVDFLLMSTLGEEMLNLKIRSGYNMASYFANRIIKGALKYKDVINKYPQYKEDINSILISEGYSDLIIEL